MKLLVASRVPARAWLWRLAYLKLLVALISVLVLGVGGYYTLQGRLTVGEAFVGRETRAHELFIVLGNPSGHAFEPLVVCLARTALGDERGSLGQAVE